MGTISYSRNTNSDGFAINWSVSPYNNTMAIPVMGVLTYKNTSTINSYRLKSISFKLGRGKDNDTIYSSSGNSNSPTGNPVAVVQNDNVTVVQTITSVVSVKSRGSSTKGNPGSYNDPTVTYTFETKDGSGNYLVVPPNTSIKFNFYKAQPQAGSAAYSSLVLCSAETGKAIGLTCSDEEIITESITPYIKAYASIDGKTVDIKIGLTDDTEWKSGTSPGIQASLDNKTWTTVLNSIIGHNYTFDLTTGKFSGGAASGTYTQFKNRKDIYLRCSYNRSGNTYSAVVGPFTEKSDSFTVSKNTIEPVDSFTLTRKYKGDTIGDWTYTDNLAYHMDKSPVLAETDWQFTGYLAGKSSITCYVGQGSNVQGTSIRMSPTNSSGYNILRIYSKRAYTTGKNYCDTFPYYKDVKIKYPKPSISVDLTTISLGEKVTATASNIYSKDTHTPQSSMVKEFQYRVNGVWSVGSSHTFDDASLKVENPPKSQFCVQQKTNNSTYQVDNSDWAYSSDINILTYPRDMAANGFTVTWDVKSSYNTKTIQVGATWSSFYLNKHKGQFSKWEIKLLELDSTGKNVNSITSLGKGPNDRNNSKTVTLSATIDVSKKYQLKLECSCDGVSKVADTATFYSNIFTYSNPPSIPVVIYPSGVTGNSYITLSGSPYYVLQMSKTQSLSKVEVVVNSTTYTKSFSNTNNINSMVGSTNKTNDISYGLYTDSSYRYLSIRLPNNYTDGTVRTVKARIYNSDGAVSSYTTTVTWTTRCKNGDYNLDYLAKGTVVKASDYNRVMNNFCRSVNYYSAFIGATNLSSTKSIKFKGTNAEGIIKYNTTDYTSPKEALEISKTLMKLMNTYNMRDLTYNTDSDLLESPFMAFNMSSGNYIVAEGVKNNSTSNILTSVGNYVNYFEFILKNYIS